VGRIIKNLFYALEPFSNLYVMRQQQLLLAEGALLPQSWQRRGCAVVPVWYTHTADTVLWTFFEQLSYSIQIIVAVMSGIIS